MFDQGYFIKIYAVFIIALFGLFLFSCDENKKKKVESSYDEETVPSIVTYNDTMFVSDSGRIRFKIMAETMLSFDKAKEPYTLLPDGAYLEEYDTLKNVITTMEADSVWNYNNQKLWKLRGNVHIVNSKGETFDSEELFWDEKEGKIYSNLYVIINRPNEALIPASSFVSNQSMTEYTFRQARDVNLYAKEEEPALETDSLNNEELEK